MLEWMSSAVRRLDRAQRVAAAMLRLIADEFRHARIQAGLSQAAVARAAGISRAELSRIERAAAPWVTLQTISAVAIVLGQMPSIRLFPDGSPLRDAGHVNLLERLHRELPRELSWRTEVPIASTGDRRAWDAVIGGPGWTLRVEGEMRIHDAQAMERRIALKRRDDGNPDVLLLVARSRANREALVVVGPRLRATFPLDSRTILSALRAGRSPGGSGIAVL
jgi:transcriptional regulator with XRE-family HTH domain